MKIGKYNVLADWGAGAFWLIIIGYLILFLILLGLSGLLLALAVAIIPIILYLLSNTIGGITGAIGGAWLRPDYLTPGWLIRFFAWIILIFLIGLTTYAYFHGSLVR